MDNAVFPLWERIIELSLPADAPVASALAQLIRACAESDARMAFDKRLLDDGIELFEANDSAIARLLKERERAPITGQVSPFVLLSAGENSMALLRYGRNPLSPNEPHHRMELVFGPDRPLVGPQGYFNIDRLLTIFSLAVERTGAVYAALSDSQLIELANARIADEEAKRRLPADEYASLPTPPFHGLVPAALRRRLSHIRHPLYFDSHTVPPAVWWVNYWSARQIASLGEARVLSAPWARIEPGPLGGLILLAVDEGFDALNRDHLNRLADIMDALDLYAVQTQRLVGEPA